MQTALSQQVGQSWDLHLAGYTERRAELNDAAWLQGLLLRIASEIGMTIANGPTVVRIPPLAVRAQADTGQSGFAIIIESHEAVHTWPESGFLRVDISSCKAFNPADARRVVVGMLGLEHLVRDDFLTWQEGMGTVLVDGLLETAEP